MNDSMGQWGLRDTRGGIQTRVPRLPAAGVRARARRTPGGHIGVDQCAEIEIR